MCEVDDDELGVYGTFYVEACTHSRSNEGGTITTVHLCKPSDMVFATDIDAGTTAPPRTIVVQVPADQQ
jgi:hypothetical protein